MSLLVGTLQWGPVVVTGIRIPGSMGTGSYIVLQWGPVVVTGIRYRSRSLYQPCAGP